MTRALFRPLVAAATAVAAITVSSPKAHAQAGQTTILCHMQSGDSREDRTFILDDWQKTEGYYILDFKDAESGYRVVRVLDRFNLTMTSKAARMATPSELVPVSSGKCEPIQTRKP